MPNTAAKSSRIALLGLLLIGFIASTASADSQGTLIAEPVETVTDPDNTEAFGFGNGSVIVAPIPFSNPLIGTGLALGAGYLFQVDENANTSLIGVGTMRSDNGSEAHGLSFRLSTPGNNWDLSATFADAALNYDLISGGLAIPLRQTGSFARLEASKKVAEHWSVGLQLKYLDTDITSGNISFGGLPTNFTLFGGLQTASVGIVAQRDTRDSDIYPTTGNNLDLSVLYNEITSGGGNYTKIAALYGAYRPISEDGVLAIRLAGCGTADGAPFYDLCSVGGTDAMRGFNPTQFLDDRLLSAQAEYRHKFTQRFGMVAFAGYGAVGDSFGSLDESGYAGGIGLRVAVSKKVPVNFAIDASHNNDGESLIYISVGERF
ncbi:BamA/TamA family outer membrane protein [Shimia abyssi]|uniref:Surface antigen-like protein n=1 Tax=Shimia abyssi TaxID=1662395 RepID=A0A2P8F064_9RHOB|nr:BamA/TamA family outer membrane protein [Shimia abyssi]PSL15095.1 surface antigen-like protein [Shimia abyssi]